jgi:hypothetical protein
MLAVALFGLFCMPLFAQDVPKAEVFGGYQLLHSDDASVHGFTGAVEGNLNKNFGIVGDFGFGRKDSVNFITFLGGPRANYRADKFRVFGHGLFGMMRMSDSSASDTNFAMAFGGGVDFAANNKISIRPGQLDIMKVKYDGGWSDVIVRYSAGIVFKLGGK